MRLTLLLGVAGLLALGATARDVGRADSNVVAGMPATYPNPLTGYLGAALEAQEEEEKQQEIAESQDTDDQKDKVAESLSEEMQALLKVGQEREAKVASLTRENEVLSAEEIEEAAVVLEHKAVLDQLKAQMAREEADERKSKAPPPTLTPTAAPTVEPTALPTVDPNTLLNNTNDTNGTNETSSDEDDDESSSNSSTFDENMQVANISVSNETVTDQAGDDLKKLEELRNKPNVTSNATEEKDEEKKEEKKEEPLNTTNSSTLPKVNVTVTNEAEKELSKLKQIEKADADGAKKMSNATGPAELGDAKDGSIEDGGYGDDSGGYDVNDEDDVGESSDPNQGANDDTGAGSQNEGVDPGANAQGQSDSDDESFADAPAGGGAPKF